LCPDRTVAEVERCRLRFGRVGTEIRTVVRGAKVDGPGMDWHRGQRVRSEESVTRGRTRDRDAAEQRRKLLAQVGV
jgi:hypothetical protein